MFSACNSLLRPGSRLPLKHFTRYCSAHREWQHWMGGRAAEKKYNSALPRNSHFNKAWLPLRPQASRSQIRGSAQFVLSAWAYKSLHPKSKSVRKFGRSTCSASSPFTLCRLAMTTTEPGNPVPLIDPTMVTASVSKTVHVRGVWYIWVHTHRQQVSGD